MFSWASKGNFNNMEDFLRSMADGDIFSALNQYGQEGVSALASSTPVLTGATSDAWYFEVTEDAGSYTIAWKNSNIVAGTPLVIMLQYGHGTGTGGYVAGRDFINPATQPIFDRIAKDVWKAVQSA